MERSEDEKGTAARRRPNGDGSIWQEAKTGQWWASLRFAKGQRPHKVRATSQKDAERRLDELKKLRAASVQAPTAQTLFDWSNKWMEEVVMLHNKRKTQGDYRTRLENYILPILGDMRLTDIKPEHIRAWQAKLLKRKLEPGTINGAHAVLSNTLQVAVNDRILPYNPAKSVRKLKVIKKDVDPLTASETAAILWAVEGHRLEVLYHLAFLGLRKGELLGIRVTDIDLQAGTITIAQQAVELAGSKMVIEGTTKTGSGKRTLPLSPRLIHVLQRRLEQLKIERSADDWHEHGLLFPSERGTIMTQNNLDRHLKNTLACAGVMRPWSWHKFRHTVITWLTELGVTDEITKAIVGHAGSSVTDRYRHVKNLAPLREALDRLEDVYLNGTHQPSSEQAKDRAWRLHSSAPHRRHIANEG